MSLIESYGYSTDGEHRLLGTLTCGCVYEIMPEQISVGLDFPCVLHEEYRYKPE